MFARPVGVEFSLQPFGLAAELCVLAHDVLEVLHDGIQEGLDLDGVVAPQAAVEAMGSNFDRRQAHISLA